VVVETFDGQDLCVPHLIYTPGSPIDFTPGQKEQTGGTKGRETKLRLWSQSSKGDSLRKVVVHVCHTRGGGTFLKKKNREKSKKVCAAPGVPLFTHTAK